MSRRGAHRRGAAPTPQQATASGTTPITLVGLVGLAVLGAFVALAVALDRIFPRKPGPEPERVEKPVPSASTRRSR